jgi:hypothetical protein
MSSNPFLSKDVKLKRVLKGFAIILPVTIMIFVIGGYYINLIDDTLREHYLGEKQEKVLGFKEEENISPAVTDEPKEEYWSFEDADLFITGELGSWDSLDLEGYTEMDKEINIPEYEAELGSVIKDEWSIGEDETLYLECEEIREAYLVPPAWPTCSLRLNSDVIYDKVRSEFFCDDYGDYTNPKGCKLTVGMILYSRKDLDSKYLFLSSGISVGSDTTIFAYELEEGGFQECSKSFGGRGGMNIVKLFYSNDNKDDIRLITYFYDPMLLESNVGAIYSEWIVSGNMFELDKKVVSVWEDEKS